MKNVLMVMEKWCDGRPDLGFTNSFHNVLNTFTQSVDEYKVNTIHMDESSEVYRKHIDSVLLDYCKKYKPDVIFFSLIGGSGCNPTLEAYKKLKEMEIFLAFMWPDTGPGWGTHTIRELGEIADLHISWDNPHSPFHDANKFPDNHLNLWVPQNPNLFYPQEQDIDVSFIGTTSYKDRNFFLTYATRDFPNLLAIGGQRESKLTPEKYAEYIRRSKIGLNFSISLGGFYQTKGRIFEIFASKSMLLEFKNPATSKLFKVNEDFVEFESYPELADKIRYYINNPEERLKIAENGHKTYTEKYTAKKFWDAIFQRIGK